MPGFLIQLGAQVVCPHQGPALPTKPSVRVKIGGVSATTLGAPFAITCPLQPPPGTPCTQGVWQVGAQRVRIEGLPALLDTSSGMCPPNGPIQVIAAQPRVKGQ